VGKIGRRIFIFIFSHWILVDLQRWGRRYCGLGGGTRAVNLAASVRHSKTPQWKFSLRPWNYRRSFFSVGLILSCLSWLMSFLILYFVFYFYDISLFFGVLRHSNADRIGASSVALGIGLILSGGGNFPIDANFTLTLLPSKNWRSRDFITQQTTIHPSITSHAHARTHACTSHLIDLSPSPPLFPSPLSFLLLSIFSPPFNTRAPARP
jgi:hypothetical protein